ncbi:hypothetical protein ACOSQ2_017153 [Xanthoceras sorbifolium]
MCLDQTERSLRFGVRTWKRLARVRKPVSDEVSSALKLGKHPEDSKDEDLTFPIKKNCSADRVGRYSSSGDDGAGTDDFCSKIELGAASVGMYSSSDADGAGHDSFSSKIGLMQLG